MSSLNKLNHYLFSYEFQGQQWSLDIHAKSQEEAMWKLQALANAKYDGEVQAVIHLNKPVKGIQQVFKLAYLRLRDKLSTIAK
jgi:hypothetical protein